MRLFSLLLVTLFIGLIACTSSKKNATTEDSGETYYMVVSFYSPGNGIDHKMKKEYIEFINTYTGSVIYEEISWGKEGEIDLCITFIGKSTQKEHDFIKESRKLLSASHRINIYENSECRHKE